MFLLSQCSVDYIVITSVDRDDLSDGGSGHFAQTVRAMKVCMLSGLLYGCHAPIYCCRVYESHWILYTFSAGTEARDHG